MRALTALTVALALLAACQAERPFDPRTPESWVRPERSPVFWTVWADVRDYVGPDRWRALDTSWMEGKARADLAALTPEDDYADEYLLSGLWRLGLLREEVLAAVAAREPRAAWPLGPTGHGGMTAWRPRMERWRSAHPAAEYEERLAASWEEALADGDVERAAKVVRAGGAKAPVTPPVAKLIRDGLAGVEDGRVPDGLIQLMECFGVPAGVDLDPVLAAARRRYRDYADETMPLPHPYDLYLSVLRLERLAAR